MQRISELWDSRILFGGSQNFRLKEFERIYALADSRIQESLKKKLKLKLKLAD
jgi:hypothetical protein